MAKERGRKLAPILQKQLDEQNITQEDMNAQLEKEQQQRAELTPDLSVGIEALLPFVTPLPTPVSIHLGEGDSEQIGISVGKAQIYHNPQSQAGAIKDITVPIWGYNGNYLGPTIEVRRNETVDLKWANRVPVDSLQPSTAVKVDYDENSGQKIPQNHIGSPEKKNDLKKNDLWKYTMGHKARGFFTTHLHGAKTPTSYDGGPEDMIEFGQSHLDRHENKQQATMLWYHDHAMHTTRLNVFAGLAGLYFIRDDREQKLVDDYGLPGSDYEIPLVLQDRNLTSVKDDPHFLHKVEMGDGPLEFFGPLNLVNGAIWPVKEVENKCYRFRILNGANSRTYRLVFAIKKEDKFSPSEIPIYQIGTDGGLMQKSVHIYSDPKAASKEEQRVTYLTLSPAERADILIDFSSMKDGEELCVFNNAESPFANGSAPTLEDLLLESEKDEENKKNKKKRYDNRNPHPEVMKFLLKNCKEVSAFDFEELDRGLEQCFETLPEWQGNTRKEQNNHTSEVIRTMAIVEKGEINNICSCIADEKASEPSTDTVCAPNSGKMSTVLVLWELLPLKQAEESEDPVLLTHRTLNLKIDGQMEKFVVVAERYQDPVSFIIKKDSTERWRFINLTADTHPMHVHLVQFHPVSRRTLDKVNGEIKGEAKLFCESIGDQILWATKVSINQNLDIDVSVADKVGDLSGLDPNESGCFKDTVRVNPGEMVEVDAKFEGYCGRYVYHCHLLEHEDHDMMRQFVVTRNDLKMDMGHGLPISVGVQKDKKSGTSGSGTPLA